MTTGGVLTQRQAFLLFVSSLQISSPLSLSLSDLLSSQENHIMLLGEAHTPTSARTCSPLSLSLSGDSFTILCSRSNPDLRGSLTGAPFNCLVQAAASRGWNDSTQVSSLSVIPLYFLLGLLSFPLQSPRMLPCSCSNVTHCSRLSLLSGEVYLLQAAYCHSDTLCPRLRKKKEEIPDFQGSFHHSRREDFPSTSYIDHTQQDTVQQKWEGKQVWLQSLEPLGQVGLQIDHMLSPHTHTQGIQRQHTPFPQKVVILDSISTQPHK